MRQKSIAVSLVVVIALVGIGRALAQNPDCTTKGCVYLPLIARSKPDPTPTLVPEAPTVRLPNGGFEDGTTAWSFDAGAQVQVNPALAHSGNESLLITGNGSDTGVSISQRVSVPKNAEYLVFWYQASSNEADCNQNLGFVLFDDDPNDNIDPDTYRTIQEFCQSRQGTTYKQVKVYITPIAGASKLLILKLVNFGTQAATWRIDDVSWQLAQ